MLKGQKGITLVALVITIIVLIILAGVTMSLVFNNGILDKAKQGANAYKNAETAEQGMINEALNIINTEAP